MDGTRSCPRNYLETWLKPSLSCSKCLSFPMASISSFWSLLYCSPRWIKEYSNPWKRKNQKCCVVPIIDLSESICIHDGKIWFVYDFISIKKKPSWSMRFFFFDNWIEKFFFKMSVDASQPSVPSLMGGLDYPSPFSQDRKERMNLICIWKKYRFAPPVLLPSLIKSHFLHISSFLLFIDFLKTDANTRWSITTNIK